MPAPRLSRTTSPDGAGGNSAAPPPPVRIVHLGLGAFHRAHQAWYTAHASDAADWGIAAFTGRSPDAAVTLAAQDGLFTLIERGPIDDRAEIVRSIVHAHPGSDLRTFIARVASPDTAILTLTLTEAGYRLGRDGLPDMDDPAVAGDVSLLREGLAPDVGPQAPSPAGLAPQTALGRVILALAARRRSGAPGLAVVPCDNLPDNGELVRRALRWWAAEIDPLLAAWLDETVSVVSTSVDRITPRPTAADRVDAQALTGFDDHAAVVTEPFADWVLCGAFPSGRPDWESAGARFVDEIGPWESRKLWMLNGAHTTLAALGAIRGHRFVHEAIADAECRTVVEQLWDEDARHLPDRALELDRYRAALLDRFANPRLAYGLAQVATDAETKVRVRIVPIAVLERADGRSAAGCAAAVASWILAVQAGFCPHPAGVDQESASTGDFVAAVDAGLGADAEFCRTVGDAMARLGGKGTARSST